MDLKMDRTLLVPSTKKKKMSKRKLTLHSSREQRRAVMFSLWIKSIDVYVMMTVDVVQLVTEREGRSRWERNGRTDQNDLMSDNQKKKNPVDILRHLLPTTTKNMRRRYYLYGLYYLITSSRVNTLFF